MYRVVDDTFWFITACEGERKSFTEQRQRNMWVKLHLRKCVACQEAEARQGGVRHLGTTNTRVDGLTVSSFQRSTESQLRQEATALSLVMAGLQVA
jgi:hypothetical protein